MAVIRAQQAGHVLAVVLALCLAGARVAAFEKAPPFKVEFVEPVVTTCAVDSDLTMVSITGSAVVTNLTKKALTVFYDTDAWGDLMVAPTEADLRAGRYLSGDSGGEVFGDWTATPRVIPRRGSVAIPLAGYNFFRSAMAGLGLVPGEYAGHVVFGLLVSDGTKTRPVVVRAPRIPKGMRRERLFTEPFAVRLVAPQPMTGC